MAEHICVVFSRFTLHPRFSDEMITNDDCECLEQHAGEERRNEFDDLVSIASLLIDRRQSIRLATTVVVRRGQLAPHTLSADCFGARGTARQATMWSRPVPCRAVSATAAAASAV